MAGWTSGWVNTDGATAVANGATLNFTHNLGSTDLILSIFLADDQAGTNSLFIGNNSEKGSSGTQAYDAQVNNLSPNSLTVQLGSGGYFNLTAAGQTDTGTSISFATKFIKVVAVAALAGPEAAGTEVKFIEPYDITPVDGAWTKIDAQPAWANSNARTLVVKAETYDFDTGGNTDQSLKARTSAASTIEVDIITHRRHKRPKIGS